MWIRQKLRSVMIIIALVLMAGCQTADPTATPMPPASTPTPRATATTVAAEPTATSSEVTAEPTTTQSMPTVTPTQEAVETKAPPPATATPTAAVPTPVPIKVEEITFQSDQFTLVGDLQIPGTGGKYPAIIMVHGSGQSDRTDWGQYLPIMERLLRAGYAVLSWDKPGIGESRGELAYDSEVLSQRASILVSAIELLKEHPAIDPERIGVWGISQAGYVMPLALTMSDDIAFMIVNSGPAVDSYDQGAYLVGQLAFCAGASEEEARSIEQQASKAEKATTYQEYLENIVPLNENPILAELGIFRHVRSEDEWAPEDRTRLSFFNPIEVIEGTTIPVLAFFGEKDKQVDPFQGAQAYEQALQKAGNQHFHVELVPGVNHVLALAETGCIDEQGSRVYAPEYLDLTEEWLVELSTALPSPGGSSEGVIAFYSERDGNEEIYQMNSDGSEIGSTST